MNNSEKETQVIIIGGGIAGCALGLFLHKEGVKVAIYEAYPRERACSEGTVGGGLQIGPNGMHVLNRLGLSERMIAEGVTSNRMVFHNQYGKEVTELRLDSFHTFPDDAVNMKRATLHQALVEEVEKKEIPMFFDKKLRSIEALDENEGPVIINFVDGTQAQGDMVAGADGAHSRVRAVLLHYHEQERIDYDKVNREQLEFTGLMSCGGFVDSDLFLNEPEEEQGTIHFLFGPKGRIMGYCRFSAADPRKVMWWRNTYVGTGGERSEEDSFVNRWKGPVPSREELQEIDTEELKQRILDIPGGWPTHIQKLVNDTEELLRGTIQTSKPLHSWYRGRGVLLGDAAHTVSPHSGQGASQALEDAQYLAKALALAYKWRSDSLSLQDLKEAFQVYQDGRKERAEGVVEEGKKRGEPKKVLGVKENPPGALTQWFNEKMTQMIFFWFIPPHFKALLGYSVDLEDCHSIEDIKKKQQALKRAAKVSFWRSTLCTVVGVAAVAVVAGVAYKKRFE